MNSDAVTLLAAGRRLWAVGLRWEEETLNVPRHRRRVEKNSAVRARVRNEAVSLTLTVRQGRRGRRVRAAGRTVPRPRRTVYSLAAVFSRRSEAGAYGVYCLDAEASCYVFLATVDGLPSVMGDVAGTAEETREALQRFLAFDRRVQRAVLCGLSFGSLRQGMVEKKQLHTLGFMFSGC